MHLAWKEKSLLVLLAQSVSHHPKVFMVPVHILTAMLYLLVDHSKCRIQRPACYFLWGAVRNPSSVTAFGGVSGSDTHKGLQLLQQSACFAIIMTLPIKHVMNSPFVIFTEPLYDRTQTPAEEQQLPRILGLLFSGASPYPEMFWTFTPGDQYSLAISVLQDAGTLANICILNVGPSLRLPKDCRMHHFLIENRDIYINLVPVWRLINAFLIYFLAFDIVKISYVPNGFQKAPLGLAKAGIYPPLSRVIFLFFKASHVYFLPSLPHFFHL